MLRRRTLPLAAIAAATLALGACGGGAAYTEPPPPPAAQAPSGPGYGGANAYGSGTDAYGGGAGAGGAGAGAEPDAPDAPAAPAAEPALTARETPDLGTVVTDVEGYTLYRFEKDSAEPPTTTCVGDCATKWPPAVVDRAGKLALEGVEKAAVGLVERPDGTTQLTINGWPVYRFSGDASPGATEGQGSGGTWFAITPDGRKAAATQ